MCKVDGKFKFSPVSVNFLTEITKVIFAIIMLFFQVCGIIYISIVIFFFTLIILEIRK
jgi:hypothetical protein